MKKQKHLILILILLAIGLAVFSLALAQEEPSYNPLDRLQTDNNQPIANLPSVNKPPRLIIIDMVVYLLGFVGLFFIFSLIYAGYQWMTSAGNEEKLSGAKARLKNSLIGMVIIFTSYGLSVSLSNYMYKVTCTEGYYCDYGKHPDGQCATDNDCKRQFGSENWKCSVNGSCLFDSCVSDNDCHNFFGEDYTCNEEGHCVD
ncbi:MAG TPA: pilin [Patescibacteria group bacterium]|nr:pilin [Patescibacteria group bacterium]